MVERYNWWLLPSCSPLHRVGWFNYYILLHFRLQLSQPVAFGHLILMLSGFFLKECLYFNRQLAQPSIFEHLNQFVSFVCSPYEGFDSNVGFIRFVVGEHVLYEVEEVFLLVLLGLPKLLFRHNVDRQLEERVSVLTR